MHAYKTRQSLLTINTCCFCVLLQVHPNHKRPEKLKLKYFHFAGKIVGKCLYESAMGNPLLVKARFTRSFLAQIIGLRIHYKVYTVQPWSP